MNGAAPFAGSAFSKTSGRASGAARSRGKLWTRGWPPGLEPKGGNGMTRRQQRNSRGYFGIGIYHGKTAVNYGSLYRTAWIFGAAFVFIIGARFPKQVSDTVNSWKHIPAFEFDSFDSFQSLRPIDCYLIGIELSEKAKPIEKFSHPERSIYLLGAEDHGLPGKILDKCQSVVVLPGDFSLNVAVAGSIVLYDRLAKLSSPF